MSWSKRVKIRILTNGGILSTARCHALIYLVYYELCNTFPACSNSFLSFEAWPPNNFIWIAPATAITGTMERMRRVSCQPYTNEMMIAVPRLATFWANVANLKPVACEEHSQNFLTAFSVSPIPLKIVEGDRNSSNCGHVS